MVNQGHDDLEERRGVLAFAVRLLTVNSNVAQDRKGAILPEASD
jgi:hypothetical protein